jgi:osmotically-inducible protein OsmY
MKSQTSHSDRQLQREVLAELDNCSAVRSPHVGVAVTDRIVTLMGTVRRDNERAAAVNAAARADGAFVLLDAISVGETDTDLAADHAIARHLVQIFDDELDAPVGITLVVRNRVITLHGAVTTAFDRQTVRRLAGYAPGANWVSDRLQVETGQPQRRTRDAQFHVVFRATATQRRREVNRAIR